jgi:heat shock protein HslJ
MTMMACEGEAQQTEEQFMAALTASTTWARNGQVVTLADEAGSTQLTLVAA